MQQSSEISVIIPVYRVEDYLDRCVESICKQTYRNLQIILVDDGSDDQCPKMCDEWAKKDDRIQVVHKKNGGLSDARNAGLKEATGEFVYFMDSDDYIVENTLEILLNTMLNYNADAVAYGYIKIDEKGNAVKESHFWKGMYCFESEKEKLYYIYKMLLKYQIGWEAWSRMYRMKIIRDNNLWFEPNVEIFAEDQCFNLYYTLCSTNIYCIPERLYYYLVRNNSIMGKQSEIKLNEAVNLCKKVCSKAEELNQKYIVKKFDYVKMSLIGKYVLSMKPEEYEYYASKLEDVAYCKKGCKGIKGYIIFSKIWGMREGIKNLMKYRKFIY